MGSTKGVEWFKVLFGNGHQSAVDKFLNGTMQDCVTSILLNDIMPNLVPNPEENNKKCFPPDYHPAILFCNYVQKVILLRSFISMSLLPKTSFLPGLSCVAVSQILSLLDSVRIDSEDSGVQADIKKIRFKELVLERSYLKYLVQPKTSETSTYLDE